MIVRNYKSSNTGSIFLPNETFKVAVEKPAVNYNMSSDYLKNTIQM